MTPLFVRFIQINNMKSIYRMNVLFKRLPIEIVRIVLSYEGSLIKERNGKYITQIPKIDPRYGMLSNIPEQHILFSNGALAHLLVIFSSGIGMTKTAVHYIRMIMIKSGRELDDTRFIWE
jgi:hypothetical protein